MIKLPFCSTKNTVIEPDLKERFEADELIKLVVYMVPEGTVVSAGGEEVKCSGFIAAHFMDEPVRPVYLAARRDRTMPKPFVDPKKMLAKVYRDFPGIPVQSVLPRVAPGAPVDLTEPHAFFRSQ